MSMNLHADGLDLWQTPTDVTRACLKRNEDGNEPSSFQVLARYLQWVEAATVDRILHIVEAPGVTPEDKRRYVENYVSTCVNHTAEVERGYWHYRNNVGKIEFYEM